MKLSEQQLVKLKGLLTYVSEHSPFYKKRFLEQQFSVSQIQSLSDLQKLSFTSKEDLQNHAQDFICVPKNSIIDYVATSGTTGKAVTLVLNENDLDRLAMNEYNSFKTAGLSQEDIIQLMTTADKRFMAGLAYVLGARKLGAGMIRVGNGLPEMQWETILELKPSVIICVPSFIVRLIEHAEKNGIDYKNSSVKKAICIGEAIRDSEFNLNALGKKISQNWDIELYSTYASSEMASAFTECEHKKGGHLQEDLLVIELIGDDDQPVKDGEAGELVVTTLGIEAMPLLRYRTGDICIAHTDPCLCGRTSLRLSPVLGRKNQKIKYKGTSLYPTAIFDVLESIKELKNYQVEVHSNAIETDELTVYFSLHENINYQQLESELINTLRSKLRVVPHLILLNPEELQSRIFPENSRKPVKFIDTRKR